MMHGMSTAALVLTISSYAIAQQYGPPGSSGGGSPYDGNPYSSNNGGSGSNPFSNGSGGFEQYIGGRSTLITAHAVLATLAFGLFFPVGAILIRLGSFKGVWLVHGIFQICAYLFYVAGAGLGIYAAMYMRLLDHAHQVIGLILLAVLFFQPILGWLHHLAFKKHSRRGVWSYLHLWIGRIVVTLGIINGGLGLQLAQETYVFAPPRSAVIGYSVAAAIVWLIYVACAIYGEVKRSRSGAAASGTSSGTSSPPYKREGHSDSEEGVRYA